MATEYKLSYTASEIDRRLGMVSTLSEDIDDLKNSSNGATAEQIEQIQKNKEDISNLEKNIADLTISGGNVTLSAKRSILRMLSKVSHYNEDISNDYKTLANEFGLYNIKYILTNVTSNNTSMDVEANDSFATIITPKAGYIIDTISVTMSGTDITETVYNAETGEIMIENVTGDIVIVANAIQEKALYYWDFTQSLVDTVEGKEAAGASTASTPTIDENGMTFGSKKRVKIFNIMAYNRTYEIDFSNTDYQNGEVNAVLCGFAVETGGSPQSCVAYRKTGNWNYFDATTNTWGEGGTHSDANLISGKTLKITIDSDGIMSAYVDDELICKSTSAIDSSRTLFIFGSQTNGYYNMTVTGMRVYEGVR